MSGSGSGCVTCDTCLPRLCVTKDESGRVTELSYWNDAEELTDVPDCGVPTDCCPDDTIPGTLTGTIGDTTGTCTAFDGDHVTLTLSESTWSGYSESHHMDFHLACNDGTWRLASQACGVSGIAPEAGATCSPLVLVFEVTPNPMNPNAPCVGSFTMTITTGT